MILATEVANTNQLAGKFAKNGIHRCLILILIHQELIQIQGLIFWEIIYAEILTRQLPWVVQFGATQLTQANQKKSVYQ